MTLLLILPILVLFYALGRSAGLVVDCVRRLAARLGVSTQFFGFILGILTTIPEMSIAANALVFDMPRVSLGNLIGGIPVILGLVLGLTVLLNGTVHTGGNNTAISSFLAAYLIMPLMLGLDGSISPVDGLALTVSYGLLLVGFFWRNGMFSKVHVEISLERNVRRDVILMILGVVAVAVSSDLIMRLTEMIIDKYPAMPKFSVGVLLFAIGTNLPEISVALTAWRRKAPEVSLSHLLGSAMANNLVIGLLAVAGTLTVVVNGGYIATVVTFVVLLPAVVFFQATGRRLSRLEGAALVAIYAAFFVSQLVFLR